jgi:hypothetical protein
MKGVRVLIAVVFAASLCVAQVPDFSRATAGKLPAGWDAFMTHSGAAPRWEIIRDATTPHRPRVLAQLSGDATRARFPLAIYRDATLKDGSLTVSFKSVSGKVDQAAGLVWRYRDPDNYYVVRANALEDNVVLYKVEKGTRTPLAPKGAPAATYGVKHKVPAQQWNSLAVTFHGSLFTVTFNGEKLFEVEDTTFSEPGKVGLWTKADSVTYFRAFQFQEKLPILQK